MLQIRLLGQFDVRADGKRVTIPSRAAQSLFAYLVLTAGTLHRREKLSGTFWPDTSDENARKNLRQELWRIRKAISAQETGAGDYFLAEELTLSFNRDANYWLDVNQLEKNDLDLQSLTSNLSLYQGELLPGFYEDWIVLERERIQTAYEARMEQLIGQLVTAERWTAVQEQSERWLGLGNAPEPAYRALMLAYGARGNIAKVASTYQRCIDELHELFGVEPSAETRALFDGLLKGAKATLQPAAFQPSSTVTFLFTDIEESTRLLEKLGGQYATVLAEHHEILRASIQKWNGHEVDTQGDAFFVTFTRASDAVQCAADAQRALASHPWTQNLPVRVRMGLHTGEPLIASTGYVGMDVHRAARIGDAAHGGQVLLSQTTRELVIHDLPPGVMIRDLGEHRLKDMKYPTPIYQLVIEGLPSEFPMLRKKFTGTEAPTPGEPPFKGLQYFDESDSDLFFGREALTAKLTGHLRNTQFLSVIIGASGSGKSSLVRAGLIPALKKGSILSDGTTPPEGSADWDIRVITPTAHPLEALATELTRNSESMTATATLMDDLASDPRSLHLYVLRKTSSRDSSPRHTLLLIDQFEELFTLCRDEFEREAFIDNLLTAISPISSNREDKGNVTLILTLRADFYAHLAQYPDLREAVAQHQEYIGPMTTDELRRAIEEPAVRGHWEFEPGLVDLILRDVGDEPGALPLLSHALLETWKRRAGHRLTLKGYADAGGVRGAIAHTAESVYQNLSPDDQLIARNLFLRLTELGEGTEDTRRRASFDELMSRAEDAAHVRTVLNRLADARLVTIGEDTAEVAHEALIREWPTLREWLNQDREGLRLHRHLTEAAHEWELLGRDAGALYRGAHLAQAREWAELHPKELNSGERAFLDGSDELEQHEQMEREEQQQRELESARKLAESEKQRAEEQTRLAWQLRKRAVYLLVAFILAGILAVTSFFLRQQALQKADIAQSNELAASSISNLDEDPELSILLALQALESSHTAGAEDALHRAVQASRIRFTLTGHTDTVSDVEFSPDGTKLASASSDHTAKIWDFASGKELFTLKGHTDQVMQIKFSPNGKRVATASWDGTAKIWDVATGQVLMTLSGHTGRLADIQYSPDGKLLATVADDLMVKIWDAESGRELLSLPDASLFLVSFSPDGSKVALGYEDGTIKIWDIVRKQVIQTLSGGHETSANIVFFSPDGTKLVSNDYDNDIIFVWDLQSGEPLAQLSGYYPAFDPTGSLLASWTNVGDLAIYDTSNYQKIYAFSGHTAGGNGTIFNQDGSLLATPNADGTIKILDMTNGRELFTLSGHAGGVGDAAFSPGCVRPPESPFAQCGQYLATASRDKTIKIWDVTPAGNREIITVPGFGSFFSPDGKRLITVVFDDPTTVTYHTWDMTALGEERETSSFSVSHPAPVMDGGFSPDATLAGTLSVDGTLKILDLTTGAETLTFTAPEPIEGVIDVSILASGPRLTAISPNQELTVWNAASGKKIATLPAFSGAVMVVGFSPDGSQMVVILDGDLTATLWDLTTGEKLFDLAGHSQPLYNTAFSPDGKRLVTVGKDGAAIVWDVQTGKRLLLIPTGHSSSINVAVFSRDGTRLATGGYDGVVKVWGVSEGTTAGQELLNFSGYSSFIFTLDFSPDGRYLTASDWGGGTGPTRVYALQIEDLMELARTRLTRTFTLDECQKYLHQPVCP